MNDSARRPGLWPARGEGVLGRQGDLVLLASIADAELADRLLALLASVAAAGGDGRELINAIEDALTGPADTPAEAVQGGPAVVAFGPVGTRLALSVSGAAWAEIDTADAIPRRVPGQPGMHLRCLLSCPVSAVRAGLGTGQADGGIDRFSQLGNGTARAGGLLYIPEDAGVFRGPGTAAPAGTAGLAEHVAPVAGGAPGPGSGAAAVTPPGTDGPAPPEPRTQLVAAAATPEPGAVPARAAHWPRCDS